MALAHETGVLFPDCITLATASPSGRPSARTVILKGHDREGFLFETQSYSRKALELSENPFAALTLYWREAHRQVTATGAAGPLAPEVSDEMWERRPAPNRAAAIVSEQGALLDDYEQLRVAVERLLESGDGLARPPTYQVYRLSPDTVEFWEGSDVRLHRRLFYERSLGGAGLGWARRYIQP